MEGFPDVAPVGVLADGPRRFAFALFAGEHARRTNVVGHRGALAYTNLPRKFAEHIASGRFGSLEMTVDFAEIICSGDDPALGDGQFLANGDVVPVTLIFA